MLIYNICVFPFFYMLLFKCMQLQHITVNHVCFSIKYYILNFCIFSLSVFDDSPSTCICLILEIETDNCMLASLARVCCYLHLKSFLCTSNQKWKEGINICYYLMSSWPFLSFQVECRLLLSHFANCCNNSADHVELRPVLVLYVVQRSTTDTVILS